MSINELPYTRDEIPVEKIFTIDETEFTYRIIYNAIGDFYTMQIKDDTGAILYTTKLVYLNNALHGASAILAIISEIIPINRLENSDQELNLSNFDTGIFLIEKTD